MIKVDENLCKGCNICTEFCPRKVYELSTKLDSKGIHHPVPKNKDKCRKCGLCALMCPDQAITVDTEEEKAEEG